jgi:hypothetical protein
VIQELKRLKLSFPSKYKKNASAYSQISFDVRNEQYWEREKDHEALCFVVLDALNG